MRKGITTRGTQSPHLTSLGAAIRDRRKALGLTQEELAARLGWSQERVSMLECAKYGMPSLPVLSQLAEGLELPLRSIMEAVGFDVGTVLPETERNFARAEERNEAQIAFNHTLQQLLGLQSLSLRDSMNEASDILALAVGAEKVDVFLYDPKEDALVALGTSHTDLGQRQIEAGLNRLPIASEGRQVQVYQTGKEYYTGHAERDPGVGYGTIHTLGVRSIYAVPLRINGLIRGILVAQSAQPDRFSDTQKAFFETASQWVGAVAHRAEMHEELGLRAVKDARQVAAEEMLTMVAHDLGNQIAPIKGRIDLLLREVQRQGWKGDGKGEQSLRESSASLLRLSRMVNDLLDASRLEGGLFSTKAQPFDLVAVVRGLIDAARSERAEIEACLPNTLEVTADPGKLRQALQNLIGNAIKHTPAAVRIVVTVREERRMDTGWAHILVHDEGPGIPADLLSRLFTRHAADGPTAGLGLGLYLARGIAAAHGGTLTVESDSTNGTTFTLSLPIATMPEKM